MVTPENSHKGVLCKNGRASQSAWIRDLPRSKIINDIVCWNSSMPDIKIVISSNMLDFYRFVPYDPLNGIDYTWEREWRIKTDSLTLDPNNTLVVVPTATEAFDLAYELADMEADVDVGDEGEAYVSGVYHVAKWLTVSLDIFGFSNLK